MKRNTRQGALEFTRFILQGDEKLTIPDKSRHEPRNREGLREMTIQSSIINDLLVKQTLGVLFFQRVNNTPIYDQKRGTYRAMPKGAHLGFPDIFVLMKTGKLDEEGNPISRVIFLEVKSSIGPQKPDQRKVELMVNELGAEYYIVRTVDFVKRIIEDSDI